MRLGARFGLLRGYYGLYRRFTGLTFNGIIQKTHFNLLFSGANLVFMPMHFAGLQGAPRRYVERGREFKKWFAMRKMGVFVLMIRMHVWVWGNIEALLSFRVVIGRMGRRRVVWLGASRKTLRVGGVTPGS
jgi:cytochrome c oxidase subunit 1